MQVRTRRTGNAGIRYAAAAALLLACTGSRAADPCDPIDPVLAGTAFVVVVAPPPGSRATSPMAVRGCSRTFESNVVWELRARDGSVLDAGHTTGGGVDGAGPFAFEASFSVADPQLGHLEVWEPDASEGEGFPTGRAVIPLVLLPAGDGG